MMSGFLVFFLSRLFDRIILRQQQAHCSDGKRARIESSGLLHFIKVDSGEGKLRAH